MIFLLSLSFLVCLLFKVNHADTWQKNVAPDCHHTCVTLRLTPFARSHNLPLRTYSHTNIWAQYSLFFYVRKSLPSRLHNSAAIDAVNKTEVEMLVERHVMNSSRGQQIWIPKLWRCKLHLHNLGTQIFCPLLEFVTWRSTSISTSVLFTASIAAELCRREGEDFRT